GRGDHHAAALPGPRPRDRPEVGVVHGVLAAGTRRELTHSDTVAPMTDERVQEDLTQALEDSREIGWGEPADYLRDIQRRDQDALAAAVCTQDGEVVGAGECDRQLALQSVSKAFTYAVALQECGLDRVLTFIGVEPSGEAFNELSQKPDGRPFNPLINAGAITAHALL